MSQRADGRDEDASPASWETEARDWLGRNLAVFLLALTVVGLLSGGVAAVCDAAVARDAPWLTGGSFGAAHALWAMIDSLRRRRLGGDAGALLCRGGVRAVR